MLVFSALGMVSDIVEAVQEMSVVFFGDAVVLEVMESYCTVEVALEDDTGFHVLVDVFEADLEELVEHAVAVFEDPCFGVVFESDLEGLTEYAVVVVLADQRRFVAFLEAVFEPDLEGLVEHAAVVAVVVADQYPLVAFLEAVFEPDLEGLVEYAAVVAVVGEPRQPVAYMVAVFESDFEGLVEHAAAVVADPHQPVTFL